MGCVTISVHYEGKLFMNWLLISKVLKFCFAVRTERGLATLGQVILKLSFVTTVPGTTRNESVSHQPYFFLYQSLTWCNSLLCWTIY